jgi:hypothetical protein
MYPKYMKTNTYSIILLSNLFENIVVENSHFFNFDDGDIFHIDFQGRFIIYYNSSIDSVAHYHSVVSYNQNIV